MEERCRCSSLGSLLEEGRLLVDATSPITTVAVAVAVVVVRYFSSLAQKKKM